MRVWTNLLASLGVATVVAACSVALPAVDHALPAGKLVADGASLPVGLGVTVSAPAGAALDVTATSPARNLLVLQVSGVRLAFQASSHAGSLRELTDKLRRRIEQARGFQVSDAGHVVVTGQGVLGVQGSFAAAGRSGFYAAFVAGGLGVEVVASGSEPELRQGLDDLLACVLSIRFPVAP